MKISIIGPGLMPIPPKGWGAVESLIWDMANALKDLGQEVQIINTTDPNNCLLYTSPSPRDPKTSRMPSSA